MTRTVLCFAFVVACSGVASAEQSGTEAKPGLLKRGATVDKPIPETYEPLNSTYVEGGEKLNESIEQSWELKKKAKEQQEQAARPAPQTPEREALEQRIVEPGGERPDATLPRLESQEKTLRISEP